MRIVLVKSDRDASNCWDSLLAGQYGCDPFVKDKMEKYLTKERFEREASLLLELPRFEGALCLKRMSAQRIVLPVKQEIFSWCKIWLFYKLVIQSNSLNQLKLTTMILWSTCRYGLLQCVRI